MKYCRASAIPAAVAVVLSFGWGVPKCHWAANRGRDIILKSTEGSPGMDQARGLKKETHTSSPGKQAPLDRYVPRNENFVLVRSQEAEARSQNLRVVLKAARECKRCADPFWLLASGFHIPPFLAGYQGLSPWLDPSRSVVVITHGLRTKRKIALTFDACSTGQPSHYDESVTQVLVTTHTPATLFLGGKWVEDKKEQAKYLASLPGLEIGNHSYGHPHLTQISEERIREEIQRTQQALLGTTGRKATLFRPPYGEYDERVVRIAAEMGLITIEYDLASGDPDKHATKEKLVEYVTSMARNGSIIVMHINRRGWHTAEALPDIIAILRKRGYTLVTVGELLTDLKKTG